MCHHSTLLRLCGEEPQRYPGDMRWLDLLSSLRPEDFAALHGLLEVEYERSVTDVEVRDVASRLSRIIDLIDESARHPEGEPKGEAGE